MCPPQTCGLRSLGITLGALGYTAAFLEERLGVRFPDDVGLLNHAAMHERLREDSSPPGVLARVLYLETEERINVIRDLFGMRELDGLIEMGLFAAGKRTLVARLRIDAVGGLYLLGDRRFRLPDPGALGLPKGDMVYPPGADSVLLRRVLEGLDGSSALDLCTGTGVQGLTVAAGVRHVTGVDIGRRATAVANANARLNGVPNFVARRGNLWDPVRDRRFDLIVANPPFVPSPKRGPAYHSGGALGDRILRRVMSDMGAHLHPRGRAFVITHLALRPGETIGERLAPWLRGFPGRSLVLDLEEGTAVDLAAAQALFALESGLAAYGEEVRRWTAHLGRHDIERVVLLLLVLERGRKRGIEIVSARPRSLSVPLCPPPADHVAGWLRR